MLQRLRKELHHDASQDVENSLVLESAGQSTDDFKDEVKYVEDVN